MENLTGHICLICMRINADYIEKEILAWLDSLPEDKTYSMEKYRELENLVTKSWHSRNALVQLLLSEIRDHAQS